MDKHELRMLGAVYVVEANHLDSKIGRGAYHVKNRVVPPSTQYLYKGPWG